MNDFYPILLQLIIKTSPELPSEVTEALKERLAAEEPGSGAASVLETLLENIRLAHERQLPLCQDTGTIHFYVTAPENFPRRKFRLDAERAVVEATRLGLLRQNCVESVTGHNTGNHLGYVNPTVHREGSAQADAHPQAHAHSRGRAAVRTPAAGADRGALPPDGR